MKFGLFLVTQFEIERGLQDIGTELATQTQLANAAGFDVIGVGEHHFTDSHHYLLNESCLSHIAQHVGDMRLVSTLILLPFHHPARIAELGAVLDILSDGQFTLGVGLGYRQTEYDVFGIDRQNAVGLITEGIEIIKRLWTEEYVTFEGEYFQLEDVPIRPQPIQEPRPPIWMGASNESSVRRAARLTDAFLGAHVPFDLAKQQIEDFRAERAKHGLPEGEVGLIREAYVAETTELAEQHMKDPILRKYESYTDWGQDEVIQGDDFDSPWEKLKHERFLVGSPEDVREGIERYKNEMELDYVFVRMQFPGADLDNVHSSIELMGEEVIPASRG